jgi:hypothetical protein
LTKAGDSNRGRWYLCIKGMLTEFPQKFGHCPFLNPQMQKQRF